MRTISALALVSLVACATTPSVKNDPAAGVLVSEVQFHEAFEDFYWKNFDFSPSWGVYLGHHQYDGKVPDRSQATLDAEFARLETALTLFAPIDPSGFSDIARLEHAVLLAQLRENVFDFEEMRSLHRNPMAYGWALNLSVYIDRDYKPLEERVRSIIEVCNAAPVYLAQARANLDDGLPRTWIQTALIQVGGGIQFTNGAVKDALEPLEDEALKKEAVAALETMVDALGEQQKFLQERLASATDDYALGEALFMRSIQETQGVNVDLATLERVGTADLLRNTAALKLAAHQIDPDKSVAEVVAMVLEEKPEPSELLDTARAQSVELRRFVLEKDLVTIPRDDVAEVKETPEFMRWNAAFLNSPGPFEKGTFPSFYYITPPNPEWPVEQQRGYIPATQDLLFITIHELWPGHFVHHLHMLGHESMGLKSMWNYAMGEGWAHYTEEMMWEAGVGDGDPRVHIGQLLNALLRNVRYISAIGLHAKGMTVEESAKLFREKAFSDEKSAMEQAVRGTFDHLYLSYTLGKLMIIKLREDWKAMMGEKYSLKAFHDAFLSHGAAPVPVIRTIMLGEDAGPPLDVPAARDVARK